jgi:ferredoxin
MSLDTFKMRWPKNVPGRFYVDCYCLDCDLCRDLVPSVFIRDGEEGYSYVGRQPETIQEVAGCLEAVEGCPQENVHDDGLEFDWQAIPPELPWLSEDTNDI